MMVKIVMVKTDQLVMNMETLNGIGHFIARIVVKKLI